MRPSPVTAWVAEKTGLGDGLSPETLRQYQFARLRELVDYARAGSRWYKKTLARVDAGGLVSSEALASLPFTTEDDLRRDSAAFVCVSQQDVARIVTLFTSGTSGVSKRLYFSVQDQELCIDFFACGMQTMVSSGDNVCIYLGAATPGGTVDLLRQGLERIGVRSFACAFPEDPAAGVLTAEEAEADCYVGLPSHIFQMSRGNPGLRPKSVLLCSDYVPPSVIEAVRGTWGCEVFTHYGSTESGLGGGVECRAHDGYHLRDTDLLVEIIDPDSGIPVPHGEPGEVVLTTLTRQAMPLIRYRTGDRSRMLTAPCACGGVLHRLEAVSGRYSNQVALQGGGTLPIHQLDNILFQYPEVLDYRASIGADDVLRLQVRICVQLTPQEMERRIRLGTCLPVHTVISLQDTPLPGTYAKRKIVREG